MADDGVLFNEFNVPVNTVHPGDNLVAVEVHQQSLTSSDISFDLMIWGLAPPAPTLRLTYNAPNFDLSWPGGLPSYCVQSKASLTDAWQDVGGVCHPADASDLPDPVDGRYHMGFDIDSFQSPTQFFRLAPNTGN
jgi:hypothetical protein